MAVQNNASLPSSNAQGNADAAAGTTQDDGATPTKNEDAAAPPRKNAPMEMILARLLTDTLAALTRTFEKSALLSGEVR